MKKAIFANFDDEGVYLYQAFKPETVSVAVEKGTFGKGFGLDRITWIKPSFAWLLRRSKYASKNRMQAIAKIKVSHQSWLEILEQSIETHFNPNIFENEDIWQSSLNKSDVIHQWDPERDLDGRPLDRQAIQVGIRGEVIKKYVESYILKVEDVTDLAKEIGLVVKAKTNNFPEVPEEKYYPLNDDLKDNLGVSF